MTGGSPARDGASDPQPDPQPNPHPGPQPNPPPDPRAAPPSLARRFRGHAEWLESHHRSPLYNRLMLAAADDIEAGGTVAKLFAGLPVPPGAVPQLRLLAALHELVLAGHAPELARFYPSAGGTLAPDAVWGVAATTLDENFDWLRARMGLTVQTNEPGRAAVLFAALLWLTDRRGLPIRLLEIGASAGLNLLFDRYAYAVDGLVLGDRSSALRFEQPWAPGPDIDRAAAASALEITTRAGCDLAPLDPRDPGDRLRLTSYIWPDEPQRIDRLQRALEIAAAAPTATPIARQAAGEWLPRALADRRQGELTVIWHSVVRQYVEPADWTSLEQSAADAAEADPTRPIAWLGMEPPPDRITGVGLFVTELPDEIPRRLATCDDHGPPVVWADGPDRTRPAA